jgi:hypothetical protein
MHGNQNVHIISILFRCFILVFFFGTVSQFFLSTMSGNNSTKGKGKRRRVDKFYQMAKEQGKPSNLQ